MSREQTEKKESKKKIVYRKKDSLYTMSIALLAEVRRRLAQLQPGTAAAAAAAATRTTARRFLTGGEHFRERSVRQAKIAAEVQHVVDTMIVDQQQRFPVLAVDPTFAVTDVTVTGDLQLARIAWSVLEPTAGRVGAVNEVIKEYGAIVRANVGARLGLRRVPALRFRFDKGDSKDAELQHVLSEVLSEAPKGETKGQEMVRLQKMHERLMIRKLTGELPKETDIEVQIPPRAAPAKPATSAATRTQQPRRPSWPPK